MTFRCEGGACLSSTVRKQSQNWLAFSADENSETLESGLIYMVKSKGPRTEH